MIEISNKGEAPVESFTLLGASTKRGDDSKIGFFGSGVKYALSKLLRDGIEVRVFSGKKEIRISTEEQHLGDRAFDVITINNKLTSLTTEMGPDWEIWQAVREIYCNAVDESEYMVRRTDHVEPEMGMTKFYIDEVKDVHDIVENWNDYFSDKRTDKILEVGGITVFGGGTTSRSCLCLYRKGIRCNEIESQGSPSNEHALYDYNLNKVEINESRVLKYMFIIKSDLAKFWSSHATTQMISNLFNSLNLHPFEENLDWSGAISFSDNWLTVINNRPLVYKEVSGYFEDRLSKRDCLILPTPILLALSKFFKGRVEVIGESLGTKGYQTLEVTKHQEYLLKEVMEFFKEVGLEITSEIAVVSFKAKDIMGSVGEDCILISEEAFNYGRKAIAATILEEELHRSSGQADKTRGFQNYLIYKILSVLENKQGLFL